MFPKIGGGPPKWMVYFMENPIKIDDLGVPLFLETPIYRILLDLHLQMFFFLCQASTCCKASQGDAYGSQVVEMHCALPR